MHRNDLHSGNGNNSIFDASGFPRKKIQLPRDIGRGWFRKRWGLLGYRTWPEGAFIVTLWQPSCFLKCSPTDLQEHHVHWLSMPCSYMVMHSSHTYIKQWVSLLPSCPALDLATCYEKNSIKSSPVSHWGHLECGTWESYLQCCALQSSPTLQIFLCWEGEMKQNAETPWKRKMFQSM